MKICHTSDNHGHLTELPDEDFDLLVCTGDFLPSAPPRKTFGGRGSTPAGKKAEIEFQIDWMERVKDRLLAWIGGKPFVWCPGNHDFLNPCYALAGWGVEVYNCQDQWHEIGGFTWYGFPYINEIDGSMMFERRVEDMTVEVAKFLDVVDQKGGMPDVLLAHAPLHGIMDLANDGIHYGNSVMLNKLKHGELGRPRFYLCGHVHKPRGVQHLEGMLISNAATTARIIDLAVH